MAEATLLPVVKSIIRHIHDRNVSDGSKDFATVKERLISFCDILQYAGSDSRKIERWITDVKTVVYDLDDALDKQHFYNLKMMHRPSKYSFSSFLTKFGDVGLLYQKSSNMRYLKRTLLLLINHINSLNIFGLTMYLETSTAVKQTSMVHRSSFFHETNSDVVQRDDDKDEIISKLLGLADVEGPSVVVILGMGGIGKTTLAKLVFDDEATHCFHIKLWVSCSPHPYVSVTRMLCGIAEALGLDIALAESKAMLVDMITSPLKNTRYLLVLDNVRVESRPFWVELKSILDVGKTGSAILITTKSNKVAFSAQSVIIHKLKCLSDSACLNIFEQTAFRKGEAEKYPMLRNIGAQILSKWDKVPLVAVFLGNLLRDERDEGTWLRIASMAVSLRNDTVVSLLKLCYDNLPSHLKSCFAYLALSQGDLHSFGPHQIYFWSAFGLLQTSDEKADIERCGRNYIRELSKSILHDSLLTFSTRIISCKLHYLLRDLATEVLGENLAVITWNELRVSHLSRHIVWGCDEIDMLADKDFPEELLMAKGARTFRSGYHMGRISKSFLEGVISNLQCLYILDLGFSHFEELPLMIGDLIHLRVLNLAFNPIIRSLPTTVCKLLNLQAFYLEGCVRLKNLPRDLHELVSLRCFIVTTCQRSLVGTEFNRLTALQELQFVSCKSLETLWEVEDIGRHISLRRLHFHDCPLLTRLPELLFNVEELVIDNCHLMDLKVDGQSGFENLRSLEISGVQESSFLADGFMCSAPRLQHFILRDCERLDSIPEDLLDPFEELQSFAIDNCPLLKTLPSSIRIGRCLEELNIKECPYLSSWFQTNEAISLFNNIPLIVIDCRSITLNMEEHKKSPLEDEDYSSTQISEIPASRILDLSESGSSTEEMKLHLRLFPADYEFESETLIQLWMASGYFRTGHMEEYGWGYFQRFLMNGDILLSRTDSLSGSHKYIINVGKIDDVSGDGLYVMLKDENKVAEGTKHQHVSVVSSSINHTIFETLKKLSDLRTLLFIGNYGPTLNQIPSDIFLALPHMETLDLSGSHITELPGSIGHATQLRYLDLSFTLIKGLPKTIDRLVELQTLKLKGCKKLYTLPRQIKKLLSLRHLYFEILDQLSFMPSGIGALTELRTLSAFIVDVKEGCNIKEFANMNNLTGSCCISGLEKVSSKDAVSVLENKEHLTRIQLRWDKYREVGKETDFFPMWYLKPHRCLEKLELFHFPNLRLPSWICEDTCKNLTSVTFLKCANIKLNVSLGTLPNLKYLDITEMNKVETIDHLILGGIEYVNFPKLKKLKIDGMSSLIRWTGISRRDFPLLSEFNMKRCPKIQSLCFLNRLGSLERLEFSHCAALESFSDGNFLGILESLMIYSCPWLKMKYSVEGKFWHEIKHVQEVWIDRINMHAPSKEEIGASEIVDLPRSWDKEELKRHFRLFPDGYEFERETMVQLWMASGYFRTGHMEESASRYFDSFLLEKHILRSRTCNLSGIDKYIINVGEIGDASNDGLYVMLKDENTAAEGTKQHVSVVSSSINHTIFETLKKFSDLRTLLFFENYGAALNEIPSGMFLALPRMETLDLSGSHITELPGSIGNATQLRYLDLSFTLVKRLPETIDRLVELQTLKLKGCKKLYTLPKQMKKLVRLRHLYFDILGQLSFMPNGIGDLTELRTLSAFIVDVEEGCNIKELRNMNNLTGSCCISGLENVSSKDAVSVLENKEHLTGIQLRWDSDASKGDDSFWMSYLKPHHCLEKLELFCFPNLRLPSWICKDTCKNLTSIRFLKCANSELNVSLGALPNLEYLDITDMNKVKTMDNFILAGREYVSFPKLKKLTIDGMSSLTTWIGVSTRDFPLLSEFNMKQCPTIQSLCFLNSLCSLESVEVSHCVALKTLSDGLRSWNLKSLIIDGCPLLKSKYSVGGGYWSEIEHVPEVWIDLINMHAPSEEDSEDTEEGKSDSEESQETETIENCDL